MQSTGGAFTLRIIRAGLCTRFLFNRRRSTISAISLPQVAELTAVGYLALKLLAYFLQKRRILRGIENTNLTKQWNFRSHVEVRSSALRPKDVCFCLLQNRDHRTRRNGLYPRRGHLIGSGHDGGNQMKILSNRYSSIPSMAEINFRHRKGVRQNEHQVQRLVRLQPYSATATSLDIKS